VPGPTVLVAEELPPAAIAQLEPGFEVRHVDGADRAALLPALADVDAVIVRSATRIDAFSLLADVPASVHQPLRMSNLMAPARM